MLRTTPYTPVFPPPLHTPASMVSASTSSDSSDTVNEDSRVNIKKSLIETLKEHYILLASLPQDELSPPSRETSPESENRIQSLRLRMRKARGSQFPHDPLLTLTCCGLRGGDWVCEKEPDDEHDKHPYVLPDTEEQWFRWELEQKIARERKASEKRVAEDRERIAKWSEGIGGAKPGQLGEFAISSQAREKRLDGSDVLDSVVKSNTIHAQDTITINHYPAHQSPTPCSLHRDDSEPVERMSSPIPPAPVLDPLPDFSDSFSVPNSPPSLPQVLLDIPFPEDIPMSPSFSLKDAQISTPHQRNSQPDTVLQLSSPISPPRSLRLLTGSPTLSSLPTKRLHRVETTPDVVAGLPEEPGTPHRVKKARTTAEPITPASVPRPNYSLGRSQSPDLKMLPTLTHLLASSRKTSLERSRPKETPHRDSAGILEFSPSQPIHSMFRPQFQSTQLRARSLPPSPS